MKKRFENLLILLVILLVISPHCLSETYWQIEKPGKKHDADVKATTWQCNKVVFDPLSKSIDLVPIPGAGAAKLGKMAAMKAAKECVGVAVEGSEILALHVTLECVCDLNVTWQCKANKVEYEKLWYWWDTPTDTPPMVGYYTYNENHRHQEFTECKSDNDCKSVCAAAAKAWPWSFSANRIKTITIGRRSVRVPGWRGDVCAE
jgi:hypothetical protein